MTTVDGAGTRPETLTNTNGTLLNSSVLNTSANGRTQTTTYDRDGVDWFEQFKARINVDNEITSAANDNQQQCRWLIAR